MPYKTSVYAGDMMANRAILEIISDMDKIKENSATLSRNNRGVVSDEILLKIFHGEISSPEELDDALSALNDQAS